MRYLLAILLFFSYQNTFSQIVRGSVSDIYGTPLEGTSIYIEEERLGIITDAKGSFQLLLKEGTYNLTYLLPEYQRRFQSIIISDNDTVSINIILERQELHHKKQYDSIDLKREIISESKKHFFSDQSYTATSYIKGQMIIKEVSDFIDKIRMKVEKKKLSDLKNAIIKQEIYALIDNISTDSTHASIIAHKGELSKDWSSYGIFDYLTSSLYQKKFNGKVSPLNGGSSYYTFLYKGSYFEDKEEINKIEVKAKIKDADLINGFLYFDNSWELHYADLIVLNKGISQNIQICYYDVYGNNRLPITTSTFSTLDLLGRSKNSGNK